MRVIFLALFFSFALPLILSGQDTVPSWRYTAGIFAGSLIPHHDDMAYLPRERLRSLELTLSQTADGSKDWHHYFNFPDWGFTLNLYDFGSPYVGHGAAAKIFFDLPLDRKRLFGLKLAIGAGYISKPFDMEDNIHNSAIGSHFNAALSAEGYVDIRLGDRWNLRPGLGLHHFSNGAFKMPNSGINLAGLRLALTYTPAPVPLPDRKSPPLTGPRSSFFVGGSGGAKEIKPTGGPKYAVVNLFGVWAYRVSPKSSLGAEAGLNYNESLRHRLADIGKPPGRKANNYRPYLALLYQLHFSPLIIRFQVGGYIAPVFRQDGDVFLRYHLAYNWQKWQIFGGLKSHYAQADNIEFGIAYRLK